MWEEAEGEDIVTRVQLTAGGGGGVTAHSTVELVCRVVVRVEEQVQAALTARQDTLGREQCSDKWTS